MDLDCNVLINSGQFIQKLTELCLNHDLCMEGRIQLWDASSRDKIGTLIGVESTFLLDAG